MIFMSKFPILDGIPEAGVVIRVHTKHDEVVGGEGSVDSWPVLERNGSGRAGPALVLHLFCHTLPGGEGFHYDPLFRDDDGGPAASASGSADHGPLPVVVGGDDVEVVEAKRQSVDDRQEANAARTHQDVERSAHASEQMLVPVLALVAIAIVPLVLHGHSSAPAPTADPA